MKSFILLSINLLLIHSCCNNETFEAGGITVHYPNIDTVAELRSYILQPGSDHEIRDSVDRGTLHAGNNHTLFINFEFFREDQILYVVNTNYRDTITNIYFERDRCRTSIKNFEFMLNGTYLTDREVSITAPDPEEE